ncbi:hypothetical protein [Tenacibaculum aiptasiae]|uniref:hypothetical protein n=1 Tax=Tenacibaculum aiptasiae TaxID=426481 RepID=UPI00232C3197|nr:hypothetical protein [Tenacibaculum aiptasiae]
MTETVMEYLTTRNSIYLTLITLIGCLAPFLHIFYGISDAKGLFGYKYMSSFLYAIGNRLCLLSAGLLLYIASSKINNEYRKIFKLISYMFLFVATFFIIHIIVPKKKLFGTPDFPTYYYWISMISLSLISGKLLLLIQKAVLYSEEKFKKIIRDLFDFILGDLEDEKMIKEEKINIYKEKSLTLLKKALDNE